MIQLKETKNKTKSKVNFDCNGPTLRKSNPELIDRES